MKVMVNHISVEQKKNGKNVYKILFIYINSMRNLIKNNIKNMLNKNVFINEMFLRDGLQSLSKVYSLNDKLYFFNLIKKCNFKNIEFGSTTNPKILPQMDNSFILWNNIKYLKDNKNLTMLITDKKACENCLIEGIQSFGLLSSVSDAFGKSNLKKSSDESFNDMIDIFSLIIQNKNIDKSKLHIRFYLSCSFGTTKEKCNDEFLTKLCKYVENIYVETDKYNLTYENIDIVLCDTYGILNTELLDIVLNKMNRPEYISLHLHTNNNFYDYIDIALKYKIYKFDSSILNVGGCPFSGKKNYGNINTYDLAIYLENRNYNTGINLVELEDIQKYIKNKLDE